MSTRAITRRFGCHHTTIVKLSASRRQFTKDGVRPGQQCLDKTGNICRIACCQLFILNQGNRNTLRVYQCRYYLLPTDALPDSEPLRGMVTSLMNIDSTCEMLVGLCEFGEHYNNDLCCTNGLLGMMCVEAEWTLCTRGTMCWDIKISMIITKTMWHCLNGRPSPSPWPPTPKFESWETSFE